MKKFVLQKYSIFLCRIAYRVPENCWNTRSFVFWTPNRHGNSVHCTIIHKAFVNCISTKKGSLTRLRDLNLTDNNAAQESKLVLLPLFRFVLFFSSPLAFGWFDHVFPGGWKKALTMKTSLKTWPHQNKNLSRNNLQDIYVIHFQ